MIGKVKDIIEPDGKGHAVMMIEISIEDDSKAWEMVGKEVVIAWIK